MCVCVFSTSPKVTAYELIKQLKKRFCLSLSTLTPSLFFSLSMSKTKHPHLFCNYRSSDSDDELEQAKALEEKDEMIAKLTSQLAEASKKVLLFALKCFSLFILGNQLKKEAWWCQAISQIETLGGRRQDKNAVGRLHV